MVYFVCNTTNNNDNNNIDEKKDIVFLTNHLHFKHFHLSYTFLHQSTHLSYHHQTNQETTDTNDKKKKFTSTPILKERGIHVGDCCDQGLLIYKLLGWQRLMFIITHHKKSFLQYGNVCFKL